MIRTVFSYAALLVLLFTLAVLQVNFFSYFSLWGGTPNLVFALFFVIIFFEQKGRWAAGLFSVIAAGFFLDMFLPSYVGVSMVCFGAAYLARKAVAQVFKEPDQAYRTLYFAILFTIIFLAYQAILYLASHTMAFPVMFGLPMLISLAYTLPFAMVACLAGQRLFKEAAVSSQLKLL